MFLTVTPLISILTFVLYISLGYGCHLRGILPILYIIPDIITDASCPFSTNISILVEVLVGVNTSLYCWNPSGIGCVASSMPNV
ncbi:hypothetical protein [Kochikohdavirus PBEF19]|uniref:Uncharacterized protein n=1 Tax=Enterococcus phage PBEF129 TaxID=2696337 RepID=A0A7T3JEJ3_9CAUD|nr:hypothetical protein [Enterococcus phage PBEF129]